MPSNDPPKPAVAEPRSTPLTYLEEDAIYLMSGVEYTYDELFDALMAEAATLPPET